MSNVNDTTLDQPTPPIDATNSDATPFRVLSPEEVTPDERRQIEIQMTALYSVQRIVSEENRIDPPKEYHERRFIWRMIFQEMIPSALILGALYLIVVGAITGLISLILVLVLLAGAIICGLVGACIYFLWRITFIVCTEQKTGIARRQVRWLGLSELVPELETLTIGLRKPGQNPFSVMLGLDCWHVKLDTAVQNEDQNTVRLHFVHGGKQFTQTISDFQSYIQSRG